MGDLISVIIPVYKVEQYLHRCVESVVEQTYKNLEIILVDDGSPDSCPELCNQWRIKDSRIKVIHKKNGGLSDARNAGIEIASGKYLAFIDSDDYVDRRFIECLYSAIQKTRAQISCVGIQIFSDKQEVNQDTEFYQTEVFKKQEAIHNLFDSTKYCDYAWNKLYDRRLFDNVRYPFGRKMEDIGTTYKLLDQCNLIAYCPTKLYYYYQRNDSILHSADRKFFIDKYELSKERYLYIKQVYPQIIENYCFFNTVILGCYPYLRQEEANYARKELMKNKKYGLLESNLKSKIRCAILILCGRLYGRIFRRYD